MTFNLPIINIKSCMVLSTKTKNVISYSWGNRYRKYSSLPHLTEFIIGRSINHLMSHYISVHHILTGVLLYVTLVVVNPNALNLLNMLTVKYQGHVNDVANLTVICCRFHAQLNRSHQDTSLCCAGDMTR